jgi:hypothetical protein
MLVTGPERERLYDLFLRMFDGRGDVRVTADRRWAERRRGERRRRSSPDAAGRRRHDRRRTTPAWIVPSAS